MFKYAKLDTNNVVVAISELAREVSAENLIRIDGLDVEIGSTYDRTTNTFTPPAPQPDPEPVTPIEQIAEETLLETKYQTLLLEMMI